MDILLHGARRAGEIVLVEIHRDILQIATAKVIRKGDEGIELVLIQLRRSQLTSKKKLRQRSSQAQ